MSMKADNDYVICVDGGICSQISFVALGMDLEGRGHRIGFDLGWYDAWGKDADGLQVRNWVFEEAFPAIGVHTVDSAEAAGLRTVVCDERSDILALRTPVRIAGYPLREASVDRVLPRLRAAFAPVLSDASAAVARRVLAGKSCAVHVRRGDLGGDAVTSYGLPCGIAYFDRAVRIVDALVSDCRFFVFSDDPHWVRRELLPRMPFGPRMELVDVNDAGRGHEDLYLMAQADCVIASHGSAGAYAALLSRKAPLLITPTRRNELFARRPNVIYLNEDVGVRPREVLFGPSAEAGCVGADCAKAKGWWGKLVRRRRTT